MSFATYLPYIVFTDLRPFDAYFPELGAGRPRIWLGIFALLLAGASGLARRDLALQGRHFLPLLLMVVTNATSEISSGNGGVAAMATDADFSPAVILLVLTALNITTARRMQFVCVSVLLRVVFFIHAEIVAYHTGFMAHEFVLRQSNNLETPDAVASGEEDAAPTQDMSGAFLWWVGALGFLNDQMISAKPS